MTGARKTRGTMSPVPATAGGPSATFVAPATRSTSGPARARSPEPFPPADEGSRTASSAPPNRGASIAGAENRDATTPPSGSGSTASAPLLRPGAPSTGAVRNPSTPTSSPAKGAAGDDQGAVGDIRKDAGGGAKALR